MQTGIGGEENEHPEPRGLAREGWKTGDKRKDSQSKEIQQKPKKRRTQLYPSLPEEWGHDVGETIDRLEAEEIQRMAFLKDGEEDMKIGCKSKQLTIKTWTKAENETNPVCNRSEYCQVRVLLQP